jgi:hypothetical protein
MDADKEGQFIFALIPFDGAFEGDIRLNRIQSAEKGHSYLLITGGPLRGRITNISGFFIRRNGGQQPPACRRTTGSWAGLSCLTSEAIRSTTTKARKRNRRPSKKLTWDTSSRIVWVRVNAFWRRRMPFNPLYCGSERRLALTSAVRSAAISAATFLSSSAEGSRDSSKRSAGT